MQTLSIIVPVYNVEPFLRRCVDSILAQTCTDFELILVDDGSPDNCGAICDEYAQKDSRIFVVHKENGGLASARNAGMKVAGGKYVLFCDSDDFVAPEWCEHLCACAEEHSHDLVFGGFDIAGPEGTFKRNGASYQGHFSRQDFFDKSLPGFAWSKVFDLEILRDNKITFPEDVIIEDLPFVLRYLEHVDSLFGCGYPEYHYYHDDRETLSKKYYPDGFRRWREKYAAVSRAIDRIVPEEDRQETKKHVAQEYLFYFLRALDNTFDERNPDPLWKKLQFNQGVVETEEFRECLALADLSREGKRYVAWLRRKNYFFAYGVRRLSGLKRKITGRKKKSI